jgi:hypothetical protein
VGLLPTSGPGRLNALAQLIIRALGTVPVETLSETAQAELLRAFRDLRGPAAAPLRFTALLIFHRIGMSDGSVATVAIR